MNTELSSLKAEEKFIEGSCGWEGYTGCRDLEERKAYSDNIDVLIDELLSAKREDRLDDFKEIINFYREKAEELEEEYGADTDETEIRCMYFDRINKISGIN